MLLPKLSSKRLAVGKGSGPDGAGAGLGVKAASRKTPVEEGVKLGVKAGAVVVEAC